MPPPFPDFGVIYFGSGNGLSRTLPPSWEMGKTPLPVPLGKRVRAATLSRFWGNLFWKWERAFPYPSAVLGNGENTLARSLGKRVRAATLSRFWGNLFWKWERAFPYPSAVLGNGENTLARSLGKRVRAATLSRFWGNLFWKWERAFPVPFRRLGKWDCCSGKRTFYLFFLRAARGSQFPAGVSLAAGGTGFFLGGVPSRATGFRDSLGRSFWDRRRGIRRDS